MKTAVKIVLFFSVLCAAVAYCRNNAEYPVSDYVWYEGHYGRWMKTPTGEEVFCDEMGPYQVR